MQLQQNILYRTQHKLYLLRIRRTRIMRINLLRRRILIQRHKPMQQVLARHIIVVPTCVVWEVVPERGVREFLGEEVDLV